MAVATDLFLLIALGLIGATALEQASPRLERLTSRIALSLFRGRIEERAGGKRRREREGLLRSVHATETYPVYASKTLLYSAVAGVSSSLLGVYLITAVLATVGTAVPSSSSILPTELYVLVPLGRRVMGLTAGRLFVLLLVSGATFGTLGAGGTYYLRWWILKSRSSRREVLIDESLARTVAFIYALSRSGMGYPEVMRIVADNRRAFGASAEEVAVVVKDVDLFGSDLATALQRIAQRSPSEQFSGVVENFASVLQTGRNVSSFLREQYEQYKEEQIANQERVLELFAALGEGYVAGLVAGPLFLLTVLIIFGILTGGLLDVLRAIVYVLIPLGNLLFLGYLDTVTAPLSGFRAPVSHGVRSRTPSVRRADDPTVDRKPRADGGARIADREREMNRIRLDAYNRFRALYRILSKPVETAISSPTSVLWVTVPVALLALGVRWYELYRSGGITAAALDDPLIQSGLLVAASFAVVQEINTRRIRSVEAAIPDFLERLASTNEAGVTFTDGLRRVDRGDLGSLDEEVTKLLNDINWGARTERALYRFADRIGSATISRIVALITNAMMASGSIGPVIRIAAEEARQTRRLQRKRRQEMFLYVVIIYLAFLVFLGIAVALDQILIPAIPTGEELQGVAAGAGGGIGGSSLPIAPTSGAEKDVYSLVLFHAAVVQATCTGIVAGKMGEGSVRNGAKHVAIMVSAAYILFLIIG